MAKIEITKTELVWPGKYNEDGTLKEVPRVSLPFQVIETVNESRATREAKKGGVQGTLFDIYEGSEGDTFEEGWKNKLIWGDNLLVMGSLLEKFAGKIDLIYIDPPFATGADFSFTAPIGESGEEVFKEQSAIEEKAYRDTWGSGTVSYVTMMSERLSGIRDLLSAKGTLYVHCDWHVSHLIRSILDDVFGVDAFVNEIAWHYFGFKRKTAKNFPRKHDTILVYSKSDERIWNVQYKPHRAEYIARFKKDKDGRLYRDDVNPTGGGARTIYLDEVPGDIVDSVWDDIPPVNPMGTERWDFPTQKPEALLERIVSASSTEGSLVADFFCGSGTTLAVAEKLGRRWIGCDLGRWAIHVTRKRLLGIENCKPFEVLNLGKYERQYWQGVTFGDKKAKSLTERALYEYLAFILKLYGAQPVAGMTHLHGKKGKAMVHIGAVDAPVTIAEIEAAVDECVALKQKELHVLGWEWEMGLYDLMVAEAKKKGVKLLLLQIPREVMEEQAAAKGDVRFFELAYLEAEIANAKKLTAEVKLKDFVIPNTELIPEDVRSKVKKWSDYIDYWAIDWDFQNDTFMQGWVAYRTRKERKLPLVSDPHTYDKPGRYRILVKVIDIFGNDTSQAFDVEVK
ncbi:MAG: site-specific DNA-methyltransferase [Acidobacteria bacterium]|nr:MAG: site-specific DNA-methyltransferase [Acidobacteriota bacterium]